MVSASSQIPTCPICHRSDKVKDLKTAHSLGIERFAPPPMPAKTVAMQPYIIPGMFIVGICIFFIIVFVGSESFGQVLFNGFELALVAVTLIGIVFTLGLSYYAFNKVMAQDEASEKLYPDWDKAVARWSSLMYCSRDDVVFDPATKKVLSDESLATLLGPIEPETQAMVHP
ncbi:MAG: hypothetical protein M3Z24_09160 [Chloroflexota bacterium]|nr:hypothetical protein [Chloroflexota bacterium]